MRKVSLINYRLSISDDSANLLRDLMECVLSPVYIDEIEERFTPDGKGAFFPTCVGARRVREVKDDLPRYMWDEPPVDIYNREIWKVRSDPGGELLLVEGDELRYLIQEAKRVREDRDKEFTAKYSRPFSYSAVRELREAGVLQ
jgi:hypothetical protein